MQCRKCSIYRFAIGNSTHTHTQAGQVEARDKTLHVHSQNVLPKTTSSLISNVQVFAIVLRLCILCARSAPCMNTHWSSGISIVLLLKWIMSSISVVHLHADTIPNQCHCKCTESIQEGTDLHHHHHLHRRHHRAHTNSIESSSNDCPKFDRS